MFGNSHIRGAFLRLVEKKNSQTSSRPFEGSSCKDPVVPFAWKRAKKTREARLLSDH